MKRTIGYWVVTGLFCAVFVVGGLANITRAQPQVELMTHLGYPEYLLTLLGACKLAGVLALLAPGFRRLKEWAYAGFTFDLIGAAYSHAMAGDPVKDWVPPLVIMGMGFLSWALRPAGRRL